MTSPDPFAIFEQLFGPQPSREQLLARRRNRAAGKIAETFPTTSTVTELVGTEPTAAPNALPPEPGNPGFLGSVFGTVGDVLSPLSPVLDAVNFGARFGSAVAINAAAEITGPGPLDSPIGPLNEFQKNLGKRREQRKQDGGSIIENLLAAPGDFVDAQQETEFPDFVKGTTEFAFDPLNLVGVGAIKAVGKGLKPVGTGIGAALKKLGFDATDDIRKARFGSIEADAAIKASAKELPEGQVLALGPRQYVSALPTAHAVLGTEKSLLNTQKAIANLSKIGPLSWALKAVNPGPILMRTPVGRASLVHMRQASASKTDIARVLEHFNQRGVPFRVVDDTGIVTKLDGTAILRPDGSQATIMEVLERGFSDSNYFHQLDPSTRQWLLDYHRVFNEARDMALENGVDLKFVITGSGENYVARFVREFKNIDGEIVKVRTSGTSLFGKQSMQHTRSYTGEAIVEGLAAGVKYETDPLQVMELYLDGIYRASRDQQLTTRLSVLAKRTVSTDPKVIQAKAYRQATDIRFKIAKSLETAISRISSGGKPTSRTLGALDREFGDASGRFGDLATELRNISKIEDVAIKKTALAIFRKKAKQNRLAAQEDVRNAKRVVTAVSAKVLRLTDEEGQILGPSGFSVAAHKIEVFTKSEADLIAKVGALDTPGGFFTEGTAKVGDVSRVFRAGFDFGAPLLQGLPLLANNPAAWARATSAHYKAFFKDDSFYRQKMLDKADTLQRMQEDGVNLGRQAQDYFRAIDRGELVPGVINAIEEGPGGVAIKPVRSLLLGARKNKFGPAQTGVNLADIGILTRAERAFSMFNDMARIEMYEALEQTAKKAGPRGRRDLAAFINEMTGALDSTALGITPGQQRFERAWLFFSPRYTRASLSLVADTFNGGLRGQLARHTLMRMATAGLGMYMATALAMGQEPHLDPTRGDFMSFRVGNSQIGIGSFWTSFVRLIGNTGAAAIDDPGALLSPSTRDNPLLRWPRGRAAPGGALAINYLSGADYLGEPLDRNPLNFTGPDSIIKSTATNAFTPFAAEAALLQTPHKAGLIGTAVELVGARQFPVSNATSRNDLRDELGMQHFGKEWEDLNGLQRQKITNPDSPIHQGDPRVAQLNSLTDEVREQRVLRGENIDRLIDDFNKERERANEKWDQQVDEMRVELNLNLIDLPTFRERIREANRQRRSVMNFLNTSPDFETVQEHFANLREQGIGGPERIEDFAYENFIALITDPIYEFGGTVDYERLDKDVEDFNRLWDGDPAGGEIAAYIQARFDEGRDIDPLVAEYYEGRDLFKFYWQDVEEATLARRNDRESVQAAFATWKRYDNDIERQLLEEENPGLRAFLDQVRNVRRKLREQNRALDAFMFRWGEGSVSTLVHPSNKGFERVLRDHNRIYDADEWRNFDAALTGSI